MAWGTSAEWEREEGVLHAVLEPLRLLAVAALIFAAPIVGTALAGGFIFGLAACLLYSHSAAAAHFHLKLMLGLSFGCLVALTLYAELLHALESDRDRLER